MAFWIPLAVAAGSALTGQLMRKDVKKSSVEKPNREDYELPRAEYHQGIGDALLASYSAPSAYTPVGGGEAMTATGVPKPELDVGMSGKRRGKK